MVMVLLPILGTLLHLLSTIELHCGNFCLRPVINVLIFSSFGNAPSKPNWIVSINCFVTIGAFRVLITDSALLALSRLISRSLMHAYVTISGIRENACRIIQFEGISTR